MSNTVSSCSSHTLNTPVASSTLELDMDNLHIVDNDDVVTDLDLSDEFTNEYEYITQNGRLALLYHNCIYYRNRENKGIEF